MTDVFSFEGHPGRTLHVWLFRNVSNCSGLQQRVQSQRAEPECSFINAAMIADAWLVHLAAFKALTAEKHGALRTHTLHGELVYNLSGTKHIGETFKKFGVNANTQSLLVCRFDLQPDEVQQILSAVHGELEPLEALSSLTDVQSLQKFYKVHPEEEKLGGLAMAIACRIAARDC